MEKIVFETERLFLFLPCEDHAGAISEFYKRNFSALKEWEPNLSESFLNPEFIKKILPFESTLDSKAKQVRYWFSLKTAPSCPIGSVTFQNIVRGPFLSCQIGYKLDSAFRGQGLAEEAVRAALFLLKEKTDLHRVEALTDINNAPSVSLLKKLGFTKEGIAAEYVKIGQKWRDCYRFSLILKK